jgi:hypothetical protein
VLSDGGALDLLARDPVLLQPDGLVVDRDVDRTPLLLQIAFETLRVPLKGGFVALDGGEVILDSGRFAGHSAFVHR